MTESLVGSIYARVKRAIRDGLITKEMCIVENDICRRFTVSKPTAGEVLRRLTQEGILKSYPRKGYFLSVYSREEFLQIQQLRFAVESMVVRRVAQTVPAEIVKKTFSSLPTMDNFTFHTTLAGLLEDRFVSELLDSLLTKVLNTYEALSIDTGDEAEIVLRHQNLITALCEGDAEKALAALRIDLRLDGDGDAQQVMRLLQPLTTATMAAFSYLSDPQLSPDGALAAVTVYRPRVEDGKFYPTVDLYDVSSGARLPLPFGGNVRALRFAPDGGGYACLSDQSGEDQIWYYDGETARQVTTLRHGVKRFSFAGEGRFLFEAEIRNEEQEQSVIFQEMTADEKAAWLDTQDWAPIEITQIDYKRDECKGVRPNSRSQIGLATLDGTQTLLTDGIPHEWGVLSHDGKRLACYGNPHTGPKFSRQELFLLDADGRSAVQLTDGQNLCCDCPPCFTEDGRFLVYSAYYGEDGCEIQYLYKVSVDGGAPVCLFDPKAAEVSSGVYGYPGARTVYGAERPYFQVEGNFVYFVCAWQGAERLYRISLAGGCVPELLLDGDFSIHEFTQAAGGRRLLTRGDYYTMREAYLYDEAHRTWHILENHNPWQNGCRMGSVQELDVPSRDGKVHIHGWVCKPVGFTEGKQYPAVLYVHGGPTVSYTNDFWHEIQILANAGFAVVYCDPRGSFGYGLRFCNGEESWGAAAYEDLMDVLDAAVALGYIDEDRLGITGGSYGGYTTCKIIMKTNRFRAAVAQRTFVNKATSYGTGDIGFYSAAMPWQDVKIKDCLLQRARTSIICGIDNIKTPLLLLHGYADYRCSFEQSEQMFITMKERCPDVPVRLVMFPGENHGVSRTGLLHFQQRHVQEMVDWFERFLKEGEQA